MRAFLVTVLVFGLVATIALPLYLGPDDIDGCLEPTESGRCATVDAIVTVSGGDTNARTAEAIRLYNNGWSKMLVFSGAAADKDSPSNAAVMEDQAVAAGVDESHIVIEEKSRTTAENAQYTAGLLQQMNVKRILLVTSAYHQRRTNLEFTKQLGSDVVIVNHPVANDSQWSRWWWATPYGWFLGMSEVLKIVLSGLGTLL